MKLPVIVDGKLLGHTASKTYFLVETNPGKHTVQSQGENASSVDLNTEAGKAYYVWQEVKMGMLVAGTALHKVDEAKGKAAVSECKLIEAFSF